MRGYLWRCHMTCGVTSPMKLPTSNTKVAITATRVVEEQVRTVVEVELEWGRIRTQCHLDTVRTTTKRIGIEPSRLPSGCSRRITQFLRTGISRHCNLRMRIVIRQTVATLRG
jgi:hypothetical protein